MRIGFPSALIAPYYLTLWKTFFTGLGHELVESGATTKSVLDEGVRNAVPEICVPVKIFVGHYLKLAASNVDLVYVPRLVTVKKWDTFCPKFLGLPDMLRHAFPEFESKILTHKLASKTEDIATRANFLPLAARLGNTRRDAIRALDKARERWLEFRRLTLEGLTVDQANRAALGGKKATAAEHPIKIGVLGYVYNLYDPAVSLDILKRLESQGASVVTFEMIAQKDIDRQVDKFYKPTFWTFTNKLLGAGYHFFEDPAIDGVIHVTAFGCGPDSMLGKLLDLDAARYGKPFMTVRVDEHSGEGHLQTRVEAFVDMIRRKKRLAGEAA